MTPRTRLIGLLALALGLWAARERLGGGDELLAKPGAAARRPPRVAPPPEEVCNTPAQLPQRETLHEALRRDPFTGEGGRPAVAAAARAKASPPQEPPPLVVAAPPPPPRPVPLPRPPYRYVGQVAESNGSASAFLALGAVLITARPGETLDGGFRLDAIGARELKFTHLATQTPVRMAIEGEAP